MINGQSYAWEGVTIKAPHGTLYDVEDIEYSDKRQVNRVRGKGSRTRAFSRGGYEGTGKLKMQRTEYNKMAASYPDGIYGGKPFQITVSFAAEGQSTVTDELQDCLFTERKFSTKVDDETAMVELSFEILSDLAPDGKTAFPDDSK